MDVRLRDEEDRAGTPGAAAGSLPMLNDENLRDQAARIIRGEIISGGLEPGRVYSARSIAIRLGVSATPVREAMIDLGKDGLLTPVRNRGFQVRRLSDRELDDVLELRLMLEVPASRRAAGLLTPDGLRAARRSASEISACAAAGDLAGFLDSDRAFHLGIIDLLGNARLTALVGQLRDQTRLFALRRLAQTELMASAREHDSILAALVDGDGDVAAERTARHLAHTRGGWAGLPEGDAHNGDHESR